jgi:hypothetical protein
MSYDINFWKQERPLSLSPEEIYGKLCKGEAVEGLVKLPVAQIHARLKQTFPEFEPEEFSIVRTPAGSIEFSWSDYHFRFDIRGICGECQKLVDVMREFGCPMYDPQENKRYDSRGGTGLGDAPKFEDATPEQKAEMERIKREALAQFSAMSAKTGCGRSAALLCIAFVAVAVVIWRLLV